MLLTVIICLPIYLSINKYILYSSIYKHYLSDSFFNITDLELNNNHTSNIITKKLVLNIT